MLLWGSLLFKVVFPDKVRARNQTVFAAAEVQEGGCVRSALSVFDSLK